MRLAWNSTELAVEGDSSRRARYRLLQSWYREVVLGARPGTYTPRGRAERPCGSLLHPDDVAANPGLNFLDGRIESYVALRAQEVQDEGGTLEEHRLRHNMLSSMPLCFNLFGMLRAEPNSQLEVVRELFDPDASAVDEIECEWTPRHSDSTIHDRTAFDAAIVTRRADDTRHLIGVETKYTEPFSPTRYGAPDRQRDAGRYRDIHESSGWFDPDAHDSLTSSTTNQLWRNCLLAAAAERSGEFGSARVVVVALADDPTATRAVEATTGAMTDPTRCRSISLERIVATYGRIPALAGWAHRFEQRYLDLTPAR